MEKPNIQDVNTLVNDEEVKQDVKVEETKPIGKTTRKGVSKKETSISTEEGYRENKSWLEVFKANYEGSSKEALELKPFLKENYKGDVYIPWAVMERLTYMCDEFAKFIVVQNEKGGLVHTDVCENVQYNAQKGEVISDIKTLMFSHTVKVACLFMGKEFVEDYPIQTSDYSAARIYDQNLVNRAIQRAKAKVASRATGLGLKLYEGFDLQFNTKESPKKPDVSNIVSTPVAETKVEEKEKVVTKKVEEKPVEEFTETKVEETKKQKVVAGDKKTFEPQEEIVETPTTELNDDTTEIIDILRNNDEEKVNTMLQRVNVSVMAKYNFALSLTDTDEELKNKISKFPEPEKFKKSIKALLGL